MRPPVLKWLLIAVLISAVLGLAVSIADPEGGVLAPVTSALSDPAEPVDNLVVYLNYPDEEMRIRVDVVAGGTVHAVLEKCRIISGDNMFAFMECMDKANIEMVQERLSIHSE